MPFCFVLTEGRSPQSRRARLGTVGRGIWLLAVLMVLLPALAMAAQRERLPEAPQPPLLGKDGKPLAIVNGRPYIPPTQHDLIGDYERDTYGPWGWTRTTIRAAYSQARGKPEEWGQDWPGFGQRFGSSAAITAINGTVRLGMEEAFHEDLRFIPCHGCTAKHKIENVLLAEITARHAADGHRFFTLTPTVSDFSGPIIVHAAWYPGDAGTPMSGVVSARTVFATRIATHLFREFVLERRHHDKREDDR